MKKCTEEKVWETVQVVAIAIIVCIVILFTTGCKQKGHIEKEELNQVVTCTDTRTGDTFSFNSNTVTNIERGFGYASYDFIDTTGKHRKAHTDNNQYMSCHK